MSEISTVIHLAASQASPAFPSVKPNKYAGFISYGDNNDFPQHIININSKSPVNKSIILSTVTYICGKGVLDKAKTASAYVGTPNNIETWDDLIEKVALDYKTFGGFYLQIILNNDGVTVSVFHEDYSKVRVGLINDRGEPTTFRIANDWKKTSGKYKPIELEAWSGVKSAVKGQAYIFHYWDYEPGLMLYSVPNWYSSIEYVKADGTLGQFYNNSIDNGFTPSVVISMPSNPSEEKKAFFQKQMENAFAGAKGASAIVILWGENDEVKPVITPFQASGNADIYNNIEGIIFQKIISAHRLASPTLAGVSGSGNLSGNAAEIIDSYVLYNYTVIEKMRCKILDKLNIFTKINGTAPLEIAEMEVLPQMQQTESITEETPTKTATLGLRERQKTNVLKRLLQKFHKYTRKEPDGKGGYRYIYEEPKGESKKKNSDVNQKSKRAKERGKYISEMRPLLKKKVIKSTPAGNITIGFNLKGNKHLYSDTFRRARGLKKKDLKNIDKALEESVYIKSAPLSKKRSDGIIKFHYFKDKRKRLYYNVAEVRRGKHVTRFLYSVTDRIK